MVEAEWTGSYPCLCSGTWILKVNGIDVSDVIPENKRHNDMDTYGWYEEWHFEDWEEVFTSYESGLEEDDWIKENLEWLSEISNDNDVYKEIYKAIQKCDWRSGSCGGCI